MIIHLPLILISLLSLTQEAIPLQPKSVCEITEQIASSKDGFTSVRGQLVLTEHGHFLVGANCKNPIPLEGQSYEPLIYLTVPGAPFLKSPVGFVLDSAKFKAILDAAERNAGKLWVVVSGKLEVFPYGKVSREGKTIFLGFGPQNASPVQLVIQSIAVAEPPAR